MSDALQDHINSEKKRIDEGLARLVTRTEPAGLYDPIRYVLASPGKRLRALLVRAASDMFEGDPEASASAALAVEVFHAFTLVHDDIMDRSDRRRGRDTVHVKWDEPTAILVGDYLQGLARELLAPVPDASYRRANERFDHTVRVLCEGQLRDMDFEQRANVSLEEYMVMIGQKTAALLQASLVLGALTGGASRGDGAGPTSAPSAMDFDTLDDVGLHMGLAFQIQDDLLDLTAEPSTWGKPIGGDLTAGKKTFLLLGALEASEGADRRWFQDIVHSGLDPLKVPEAYERLKNMGVLEAARSSVIIHSGKARSLAETLPSEKGRDVLIYLIDRMERRVH